MKGFAAIAIVAALYVLHQDVWFWRTARPMVFGFLPVGLFYHAAFTVATAAALWAVVVLAWPAHLEDTANHDVAPSAPRAPNAPNAPNAPE